MTLNSNKIDFVESVKNLGAHICNSLTDDDDIARQVWSLYCYANMLKHRIFRGPITFKNLLFRAYCTSFYACQLWCKFTCKSFDRLRAAYNDSFRILHNLPRCCSARTHLMLNELLNSDRHVDHDKHLQSQPTSEGAYTMLSLKFLRSLWTVTGTCIASHRQRALTQRNLGTIHLKKG